MAQKKLTRQQKSGEDLISLSALELSRFDKNSDEPESSALKQAVDYAVQKKLPGIVVIFTMRRTEAKVTLVNIAKYGIVSTHPQCVRSIKNGYYAMRTYA